MFQKLRNMFSAMTKEESPPEVEAKVVPKGNSGLPVTKIGNVPNNPVVKPSGIKVHGLAPGPINAYSYNKYPSLSKEKLDWVEDFYQIKFTGSTAAIQSKAKLLLDIHEKYRAHLTGKTKDFNDTIHVNMNFGYKDIAYLVIALTNVSAHIRKFRLPETKACYVNKTIIKEQLRQIVGEMDGNNVHYYSGVANYCRVDRYGTLNDDFYIEISFRGYPVYICSEGNIG